jgi:ubiquinone/menaquinone biosynthesis C-methylase UbiE
VAANEAATNQLKLNNMRWVAKQYKTPNNLNARIQLHQRFSTNSYRWPQWVFDHLHLAPGMRVLEIGGGPGGLWHDNRDRLPLAMEVIFTDQSPGMIAQALATLGTLGQFRFAVLDAQSLPFATGLFDVVIANHMLYHVPDRRAALAEIRRVLKPSGHFFAATNDHNHMQELRHLSKSFLPSAEYLISNNERFPFAVATQELSEHFGQIQLHRYHNNLIVTDADVLADYMLSGIALDLPATAEMPFRQWLHKQILAEGAITITSATGLFEATTVA